VGASQLEKRQGKGNCKEETEEAPRGCLVKGWADLSKLLKTFENMDPTPKGLH
jgi:hypothetical protein